MKKLLKILTTIAAVLTAAVVFTTCKQFRDDPEEFLSYWASEAVINRNIVISPAPSYAPGSSIPCVPSAGPVTVTMKVHNPKNFTFIMPDSPGAPSDIVRFEDDKVKGSGGAKPVYGTDYTLELILDGKALKLTYNDAFLKANERSSANIGASITLYSTDGRKFNQTYSFDLEANTSPPDIAEAKWGKTVTYDADGKYHYVLCISVPAMPGTPVNGGPLHKDIAHIAINDTEYELKMNTGNTDFKPMSDPFLTAGEVTSFDGAPLPSGPWVLYYTTPTELGSPQTSYTVTLKDAKGLWSQASATTPPAPITDWETLRTAIQTASDGAVITVGGDITYGYTGTISTIQVTKSIIVKSNVNDTKRTLNAGGTGEDGVPANPMVEAVFEVNGSGITLTLEDLTLTKTEKYAVYVHDGASLVMNKVTIEDCKTESNAAGIYFHEGKNLSITNSLIKKCKGKRRLSSGGINIQAPQAGGTLSITNTKFENCKAVGNGTDKGDGGGIRIYKGSVTLTGCTFTGCEAKNDGGAIYVSDGGTLTLRNVTIGGNTESDANTASNGGGICLTGSGTTGTMTGGKIFCNQASNVGGGIFIEKSASFTMNSGNISGNTGDRGGGVYIGDSDPASIFEMADGNISRNSASYGGGVFVNGTFKMKGGATVTLSTGGDAGVPGKNDVYLMSDQMITLTGMLSQGLKARITPQTYKSIQVLNGYIEDSSPQNYTKFKVTRNGSQNWTINNRGFLQRQ